MVMCDDENVFSGKFVNMYIGSLALILAEKSTDSFNPYVVDKRDI